MTAKEKLLLWSQRMVEGYQGLRCDNFTSSWRDGRLFNAIIHRHRYMSCPLPAPPGLGAIQTGQGRAGGRRCICHRLEPAAQGMGASPSPPRR